MVCPFVFSPVPMLEMRTVHESFFLRRRSTSGHCPFVLDDVVLSMFHVIEGSDVCNPSFAACCDTFCHAEEADSSTWACWLVCFFAQTCLSVSDGICLFLGLLFLRFFPPLAGQKWGRVPDYLSDPASGIFKFFCSVLVHHKSDLSLGSPNKGDVAFLVSQR